MLISHVKVSLLFVLAGEYNDKKGQLERFTFTGRVVNLKVYLALVVNTCGSWSPKINSILTLNPSGSYSWMGIAPSKLEETLCL